MKPRLPLDGSLAVLVCVIAIVGCGNDRPSLPASAASAPAVRDSSGVRIVEGDPFAAQATLRILDEPVYRVGWTPGGPEFAAVSVGTILSDGRVAVADLLALRVSVLSPDGELEHVLGREGNGPGEFIWFSAMATVGEDTVVVQDLGQSRVTMFHEGELLRTVHTSGGRLVVQAGTEDGDLLLAGLDQWPAYFEDPWLRAPLARLDLATGQIDTVALVDFRERIELPPLGTRFSPRNTFGPFGNHFAWPEGFVTTRSDRAEIRWLDSSGSLTQVLQWEAQPIPLTDSIWAAFETRTREERTTVGMGNARYTLDQLLEHQKRYARGPLPLFGGSLVDFEGNVWLREYEVWPEGFDRFFLVSPQGEPLGPVSKPRTMRILDIGHGFVLAEERNELEVSAVALYRLERLPQ